MKSKAAPEMVQVDVHDVLSIMRFRCGDPMEEADYKRLNRLRPGKPCPRLPVASAFAWNKKQLAEQIGVSSAELDEILALPHCPGRRGNGRWRTDGIIEFLRSYMEAHAQ
jgi:hypothetical protein